VEVQIVVLLVKSEHSMNFLQDYHKLVNVVINVGRCLVIFARYSIVYSCNSIMKLKLDWACPKSRVHLSKM
jgi:hypothetical protein